MRIPMTSQRRGGSKGIGAPGRQEACARTKPQPDGTLVTALAGAWRWQRMLDDGVYASVSAIGDAEDISKGSCGSRILRLALLASDYRGGDARGRTDQRMILERPLPASCEEQRKLLLRSS